MSASTANKDRVGEIINGVVKRVEYGNVIVDLGRAEGVIRKSESIPRENLRVGDRTRAYIYDVRRETKGPQIFLSRAKPEFMARLFAQEVPEVYEGVIEIKAAARDPGSRAKIAVVSHDSSIDPVGACVGMRGARVQVSGELGARRSTSSPVADPATFIVNALQPEVPSCSIPRTRGLRWWWAKRSCWRLSSRQTCAWLRSSPAGRSISSPPKSERRRRNCATRTEFVKAPGHEMFAQLLASGLRRSRKSPSSIRSSLPD